MVFKALTALASPAGARAKLTTFIFHRVLSEKKPLLGGEPDREEFDRVLSWITGQYIVLCPLEACERLSKRDLPSRAATITFDDGYMDNHQNAMPLLQKHKVTACFFVATGFTGAGAMFNDRVIDAIGGAAQSSLNIPWLDQAPIDLGSDQNRRVAIDRILSAVKSLPPSERSERVNEIVYQCGSESVADLMMNESQIKDLVNQGMIVGGHTRTHPILRSVDDETAQREISDGYHDIKDMTGIDPMLFAYPNGRPGLDFSPRHMEMVSRADYKYAFTTQSGVADYQSSPYGLPRFTPWDSTYLRFGARALLNTACGAREMIWQS